MTSKVYVGDVLNVLEWMGDEELTYDLAICSPPFLALRSYLPDGHPWKAFEGGQEGSPAAYLAWLLDVAEAVGKRLSRYGSLVFELGDTASGSGGAGGDYNAEGLRAGQQKFGGTARKARRNADDYPVRDDHPRQARNRRRTPESALSSPRFREGTPRWDGRPEGQVRTTSSIGVPVRSGLANFSDQRGNPDGMRDTTFSGANTRTGGGEGWPLDKSLCIIPAAFAASLAYGRNILAEPPSAEEALDVAEVAMEAGIDPKEALAQAREWVGLAAEFRYVRRFTPWRVRNLVSWCRTNPPVGDLGDKFRPATTLVIVACRARNRWFDLESVRVSGSPKTATTTKAKPSKRNSPTASHKMERVDSGTAPPLDWERYEALEADLLRRDNEALTMLLQQFADPDALEEWCELMGDQLPFETITPRNPGFKGSHYATFPVALIRPFIQAMTPRRVCVTCGEPSRRIVRKKRRKADDSTRDKNHADANPSSGFTDPAPEVGWEYDTKTIGWSTCGCPGADGLDMVEGWHTGEGWRPGVAFDPFVGSGTTLEVALDTGRDGWGVDLDTRNLELIKRRLGFFSFDVKEIGV